MTVPEMHIEETGESGLLLNPSPGSGAGTASPPRRRWKGGCQPGKDTTRPDFDNELVQRAGTAAF